MRKADCTPCLLSLPPDTPNPTPDPGGRRSAPAPASHLRPGRARKGDAATCGHARRGLSPQGASRAGCSHLSKPSRSFAARPLTLQHGAAQEHSNRKQARQSTSPWLHRQLGGKQRTERNNGPQLGATSGILTPQSSPRQ